MSSEEFWEYDPQLFVSYRISFIKRKEREAQEIDYKCWLQGAYNHNGNSVILAHLQRFITGIFKKSSGSKIEGYPLKPYSELKKEEKVDKQVQDYDKFQEQCVHIGTLKKQYLERLKEEARKEKQNGNKP